MDKLPSESPPRLTWQMFHTCNFNCSYCYSSYEKIKKVKNYLPTEIIATTLKKLGNQWILGMTGGEPLLHPNFVELCEAITKTHKIRFDTNLSLFQKVKDFVEKIDPEKV